MRVLFFSNIPSPYRIDFYNYLGRDVDLTVVFEARRAKNIQFNWNDNDTLNFEAVFLKKGEINEKRVNLRIFKYLIRCKKYDFVFITNYGYITEFICAFILALSGQRYCLELDGAVMREQENKLKYLMKKLIITHAGKLFSPSSKVDEFFVSYGASRDKIVRYPFSSVKEKQILECVPSDIEKQKAREKLKIWEKKVVLAVGQFIHRKGFDVLLETAAMLSSDVGFYFVGGVPTMEYLAYVESNKMQNVHFIGFKNENELKEYYVAADLFCLPTREDVWGLVINEAMAHGLPIITTNKCGAGIELIQNENNGIIVPINNAHLLAEKISCILDNEEVKQCMARNNLQKSREYTIENMAKVHLEVLGNTGYKSEL